MNKEKCYICGTTVLRMKQPGICTKCYLENKKMMLKGYWHLDKGPNSDLEIKS